MIIAAVLVLAVRTWVVMGFVVPLEVSASSMAPALVGPHLLVVCPECRTNGRVAAERPPQRDRLACLHCGSQRARVVRGVLPGDLIRVDRTRTPKRWDPVVFRNPHEGGRLCVKRIIGLPGERFSLRDGDAWAGSRVLHKSITDMRRMRIPVPAITSTAHDHRRVDFLPRSKVFTDDLPYNGSLTRRLNPVSDLMVSAEVVLGRGSGLAVEIGDVTFSLCTRSSKMRIASRGEVLAEASLAGGKVPSGVLVEVATFDCRAVLAIEGKTVLSAPLEKRRQVSRALISVTGEGSQIGGTGLWRDVYYTALPGRGWASRDLVDGEFFLLGDNSPVSWDSRHWGPADAKWLIGSPLRVR